MRLTVLLVLLLSLGRVGSSEAQSGVPRQLAAYMQGQQAVNHFAGVVLVTRHDSVLLQQAYGLADAEWQVPNTPDTRFALASITKQFTAIALLQLAERGQLRLTDKLSQYVPGMPNGDAITLHQLLTHTAGLALDFEEVYLRHTDATKDSALAFIRRQPVQFAPGARIGYSNVGYFLLALIIEKASGLSYGTYLQRNILDVAGLRQTGLLSNTTLVPGLARLYYREGAALVKNPYINWDVNVGHDGLYATAGDLLRLSQALRGTTLLSSASLALMNTPHNKQFGGSGFLDRYGYGVFIDPYYNLGHHLLTHSGGYFGAMTTLDRYPQDEVVVIVLSNNEAESHIISYGLAGILFGKPVEVPYEHRPMPAAPPVPLTYAGHYGPHHILYANGQLYLQDLETPLVAETPTKFYSQQNPDRTVEFLPTKAGKVEALILTKGGVRETFRKTRKPGKR
ncbi:serine hydrolase domain-containing protein [Hymenobacter psychrophilus]|uniref:CubicO group peptidase, beta-lactamase class C family n=1 Tax=Hymenobacter psychrophilus TaxID=651662 RepID=A0A1H3MYA5_9BACT|nr:serine hydrolase domain-containing protein [Hymenobacter psychrophilus]SDY80949.1 CubicO group peptidase, beta-lactamase class C family [Hymenobacter psychrophilus]